MYSIFEEKNDHLPPSLPNNWPHPTQFDLEASPQREIHVGTSQAYSFSKNFVKTSKYELWNFLPKFLIETFNPRSKIANCYFLLIAICQCIPAISNTSGYPTTLIPLIVVVTIDGIFQALEDINRHKADLEANSSITKRYDHKTGRFFDVEWSFVEVGDILKVCSHENLPADLVVLCVSGKSENKHPSSVCYVETKSLDGETNLKIKNALPITFNKVTDDISLNQLVGTIVMEHPNKLIDTFSGVIDLLNIGRYAIEPQNVLLRGCVLRNTEWVVGIVVNTGHDTKIMMSATETTVKYSKLESEAAYQIKRIIVLLIALCLVGTIGHLIWDSVYQINHIWYLRWKPNAGYEFIVMFFYFLLLHATFIPVSLYVSMSIARYCQRFFMNNDLEMYYSVTDTPASVRTMTLNEELGQITHVFTDKTGTLTRNVMDFRKASINGVKYGLGITEIGKSAWKLQGKDVPQETQEGEERAQANAVPHVSFYCPDYEADMRKGGPQAENIDEFFRILSICHDVIPENLDGKMVFSASNPDDQALVCAAEYFGFAFRDRKDGSVIILEKKANKQSCFEILDTLEFSSQRKRMSVIVQNGDSIALYCKGADSVVLPRLSAGQETLIQKTESDLRQFAAEGLRVLIVAKKVMSKDQYIQWKTQYKAAKTDMIEIEKRKKRQKNMIDKLESSIEKDLILLGATAIEDRLQFGVPQCISNLMEAKVNVWVLTGDKEETAINVAIACNVLQPENFTEHIIINRSRCPTANDVSKLFDLEIQKYYDMPSTDTYKKPRSLIIDGPSLMNVMNSKDIATGAFSKMLRIVKICKAVVCCRMSPDQKREVVQMVKNNIKGSRTLAIGDGANDVAMIQEAHVGVGIKGEEGMQAVNAADFAIAQFEYLATLMLKHGRYNYIRMSNLICYMFYKNVFMSVGQFWLNFNSGFSGQKFYFEFGIQFFNLIFTSIPILVAATFDMDVLPSSIFKYRQLYQGTVKSANFNTVVFWQWIASAICESAVISSLSMYLLGTYEPKDGSTPSFWETGALCFTAIVIVVNIKIFFVQQRWNILTFITTILSVLLWFATGFLICTYINFSFDFYTFHVLQHLTSTSTFWLALILIVLVIYAKDVYVSGLERNFNYKPYQVVAEIESFQSGQPPKQTRRSPLSLNKLLSKFNTRMRPSSADYLSTSNTDMKMRSSSDSSFDL